MTGDENSQRKGDIWGQKGYRGNNNSLTPRDKKRPVCRPMAARGRGGRTRDTAEESVTRRREERRAAESGGWRVEAKSRWMTYHAGRVCGERAIESSETMLKATDGGRGRRRRNRMIQKMTDTGGEGR